MLSDSRARVVVTDATSSQPGSGSSSGGQLVRLNDMGMLVDYVGTLRYTLAHLKLQMMTSSGYSLTLTVTP